MVVLGASLEAGALSLWIVRDAFAYARRPAFKWADWRKRKM
ncbi:hypothetical protein [Methylocystis parvus]